MTLALVLGLLASITTFLPTVLTPLRRFFGSPGGLTDLESGGDHLSVARHLFESSTDFSRAGSHPIQQSSSESSVVHFHHSSSLHQVNAHNRLLRVSELGIPPSPPSQMPTPTMHSAPLHSESRQIATHHSTDVSSPTAQSSDVPCTTPSPVQPSPSASGRRDDGHTAEVQRGKQGTGSRIHLQSQGWFRVPNVNPRRRGYSLF
ncbi:hypothetical protein BT96DRAFT_992484 [Gymnopus androsaceus JB14]|uniref:Uncharacterized protein n=1 Tax=Gymnopus androsaceus JB14 TaxID=1447944 RepID=A0A6A4HT30_9AGAR|nr:hypothetical protein BT96DRAFT_992484 [Gymnopus androsaceus JB14]